MGKLKTAKISFLAFLFIQLIFNFSCSHKKKVAEITTEELLHHIRLLSDDIYEGRGLGS